MHIIAFEGLDKSGKYSQVGLLTDALQGMGLKVIQDEFHRYDTRIGEIIGEWLRGEYEADQYTIELLMAADKQAQQANYRKLENEGVDVLILDRYTGSQWAYSLAQGVDMCFAEALQFYMRLPDTTILLDIEPEVSMKRKGKHNGGENDRYESDLRLLTDVRQIYKESLTSQDLCIDGSQSVAAVHEEVLRFVQKQLKPLLAVHTTTTKGETT